MTVVEFCQYRKNRPIELNVCYRSSEKSPEAVTKVVCLITVCLFLFKSFYFPSKISGEDSYQPLGLIFGLLVINNTLSFPFGSSLSITANRNPEGGDGAVVRAATASTGLVWLPELSSLGQVCSCWRSGDYGASLKALLWDSSFLGPSLLDLKYFILSYL